MAVSSTAIAVMWEDVSQSNQFSDTTMYEVMYTPLESIGGTVESNMIIVLEPTQSVVLTGLEEYVNYSISVRAYSCVGPGPYSVDLTILTNEDGEACSP